MRTAIVHYWLLNMRGGEKVLEALCRLLPDADIFTLFYDPSRVSDLIRSRRVTPSVLNRFRSHYRSLLPLMPMALEHFDLRGYDLVISSESGPAKGVLTSASARHICYCHTPMRYLWDLYPQYLHEWTHQSWKRGVMALFSNYLRIWDYSTAARVDQFLANSDNVRRRIWRAYRREAEVVFPPVAVETFYWKPPEDYFLVVAEFVAYKRVDLAVRVCTRSGRKLKVVGGGPEFRNLRKLAGPGVEFCGRVSDEELRRLYSQCRAFVMPAEEDFGITAVEALASGKPIVGYRKGGLVEIAPEAVFFEDQTEDALLAALDRFEELEGRMDPERIATGAVRFSEQQFAARMKGIIGL